MAKFSCVADVLSWAKIPGVATWRGSAAGRLLDLLGCADVDDGLADISEFASIEPETLDEAITKWTFSKFKSPEAFTAGTSKEADDVDSDGDLTESPKAMVIARAKMAHNVGEACVRNHMVQRISHHGRADCSWPEVQRRHQSL